MGRGRPGGNPDITKYSYQQQYDWSEPCTASLTLKLPASLKEKLKKIDGWQEKVREAIAEIVAEKITRG